MCSTVVRKYSYVYINDSNSQNAFIVSDIVKVLLNFTEVSLCYTLFNGIDCHCPIFQSNLSRPLH